MAGGRIDYTVGFKVDMTQLNSLKTQLQQLSLNVNQLYANNAGKSIIDTQKFNSDVGQVKSSIAQLEGALTRAFNTQLGTLNITKFNQELKGLNLSKIQADMASLGAQGQNAFRSMAAAALSTNMQLKQSHTFLRSMADTMANTLKWGVASSVMNTFAGSVRKAYGYVKELDKSLNDIRIVTKSSAEDMEYFAKQANKAAKELHASTTAYTQAALIYAQQGLQGQELEARTDVTMKVANVTGVDAEEASEYLTAVWNGYQVSAQETEVYIDKLANVAAHTASDLEELSTGMSKVASAANIMGVDVDQLNAQLSTIISVTREAPETIGTSLKTVYARMADIEAGLDEETTLGNYTSGMAELGINVLDAQGKLRDTGEVVEEIGDKWNTMSREQQIALARTIAGQRQYSRMLSLFDNWDKYNEALEYSKNATGELQTQQDIYADSVQAHLADLQATTQSVYSNLMESDGLNSLIENLTDVIDLFDNFIQVIGGGTGAVNLLTIVLMKAFSQHLINGLTTFITNMDTARYNAQQLKSEMEVLNQLELAAANGGDKSLSHIVSMKKEALQYSKAMTVEDREALNQMIQQTEELYKQRDAIEAQKKAATELLTRRTVGENDKPIDLTTEKGINSAKENLELTKGTFKTQENNNSAFIEAIEAEDRAYASSHTSLTELNQAKREAISATEIYIEQLNKSVNDGQLDNTFKENSIQLMTTLKDQINEYNRLEQEEVNITAQLNELKNKTNRTAEEEIKLQELENKVTEIGNKKANQYSAIQTNRNKLRKESTAALQREGAAIKKTEKDLSNMNVRTIENKAAIENADATFKNFMHTLSLKNAITNVMNFTQGIGSLAMGMNTLGNAWNALKDPNLDGWQKFSQVAMGISMGLPMLTSGLTKIGSVLGSVKNTFLSAQAAANAYNLTQAKSFYNTTKDTAIKATYNQLLITEARARGTSIFKIDEETKSRLMLQAIEKNGGNIKKANVLTILKETIATKANSVANWWNAASQAAKFWYITLIVAAIGALIALTVALTRTEDENTKALKKAREERVELKNTYDELTDAAKKFKEEISSYDEGVEALKNLDKTSEEYRKKLEELNAEAELLIEKYDLFGKYTIGDYGEIIFNEDALAKLEKKYTDRAQQARLNLLAKDIEVNEKESNIELGSKKSELINNIGYLTTDEVIEDPSHPEGQRTQSIYSTISNSDIDTIASKWQDLRDEEKDTKKGFTSKDLIEALKTDEEVKLSQVTLANLEKVVNDGTLRHFQEINRISLKGQENENRYMSEIINTIAEDKYAEKAKERATDKNGKVDAAKESLYKKAYGAAAGRIKEDGEKISSKYTKKLSKSQEGIESHIRGYDAAKGIEEYVKGEIKGLGLNASDVSKEAFGTGYKGNIKTATMYERILEGEGATDIAVDDKNGKVAVSYKNKDGELEERTLTNEEIQERWAEQMLTAAYEQKIKKTMDANEKDMEKMFDDIENTKKVAGVDWTNTLLSASMNQEFDMSSLWGGLTEDEVSSLKEKDPKELMEALGLSEETIKQMGFDTAEDFEEAFDKGLDEWDTDKYNDARDAKADKKAEKYELDLDELEAYRDLLAETYPELEENRDALNDVAIANMRMEKGVKKIADKWEDYNKVMTETPDDLEAVKSIMPEIKEGLQDILNLDDEQFELLPPNFARDNWNLIQDVMNNVEGSVDKLRDKAGQEMLMNVVGVTDFSQIDSELANLHNQIAAYDQEKFTVTADINNEDFIAQCDALIAKAGMSAAQAEAYFAGMGYDADVEEITVTKKTPHSVTYPIIDKDTRIPTGETKTVEWEETHGTTAYAIKTITPNGSYGGGVGVNTTAPKTSTAKKSGGGGGGSKKKAEKVDQKRDVYKTIDSKIKQTENDLVKLEKERERLSGGKLIQNLNKQLKNLEQQKKLQEEKLQIALEEERKLRQEIQQAGEDGYAFGIQFDAEGNIINYDQIAEQELAALKAATDRFNASAQSEADQEAYDKAKERYEKFEELMDEYYDLHDNTISDIENQIQELYDQVIEMQVEKFTMDIELQTNFADIKNEWLELRDSILYSEKAFGQTAMTAMSGLKDSMAGVYDTLADVEYMQGELAKIKAGQNSDLFGNNEKIANETINDTIETTQEWVENSLDYIEAIEDAAISAMEEIINLQSEMIDSYDNLISALEHKISLKELIGGDAADTTEELQETFNIQLDIAKTAKKNLDDNRKYLAENGEWLKENNPEEYLNYVNNVLEAEEQVFSSVEEAMTTLNDLFDKGIENMLKEVETAYAGALGWEELSTRWENDQELAELYLTSVQKEYELQKMINKVNQDILDKQYDSIYAQQKLNDFKENYIKMLEKEGDLTQAQVDRMNKMYELTLLQIALEEAKNNKSSMKLTRDSQGNYAYQYTTDEAEVAKREQELADKKNEIYKQDIEDTKSAISDYISAGKDAQSEYMDLFESEEFKRYMELSAESVGKELTPEEQAELDTAREKAYNMLAERAQTSAKQMEAQRRSTLEGINNILKDVDLQEIDWTQDYDAIMDNLDEKQLDTLLDAGVDLRSSAFKSLFGFNSNTYLHDILNSKNGVWNGYLNAVDSYGNNLGQVLQAVGSKNLDGYYDNIDLIYQEVQKLQDEISQQSEQSKKEFEIANNIWKEAEEIKKELQKDFEEGGRLDKIMDVQIQTLYNELVDIKKELGKQTALLDPSLVKTGWQNEDNNWSYNDIQGNRVTDWHKLDWQGQQDWYMFDETGKMKTNEWIHNASGTWSYVNGAGQAVTGWEVLDWQGKKDWYHFDKEGTMNANKWIGDYFVGSGGQMLTNTWVGHNGMYYWVGSDGKWLDLPSWTSHGKPNDGYPVYEYNTGGYTGSWFNGSKDGRLAFLHQKELILNEKDTPRILDAVKLVREISTGSIIKGFEAQMRNTLSSLENQLIGTYANIEGMAAAAKQSTDQMLEQAVHIDASFPGVKDAREIEEALNNLVNIASQYAYENNK